MQLGTYLHPFDLTELGARGGVDAMVASGFAEFACAATYHAGRWLRPWSRDETVRFLDDGTVHFPPQADYRSLQPMTSREVAPGVDPLAEFGRQVRAAGGVPAA